MEINMLSNCRQIIWAIVYGFVWSILGILFGVIRKATSREHKLEKFKTKIYSRFSLFQKLSKVKLKKYNWLQNVVDFIFCVFTGVSISIFAYATNDGIIRWFAILIIVLIAWITSVWLYYPIRFLNSVIFFIILGTAFAILRLFYIPMKLVVKFIFAPIFFRVYNKIMLLFLRIYGKIKLKKTDKNDCETFI